MLKIKSMGRCSQAGIDSERVTDGALAIMKAQPAIDEKAAVIQSAEYILNERLDLEQKILNEVLKQFKAVESGKKALDAKRDKQAKEVTEAKPVKKETKTEAVPAITEAENKKEPEPEAKNTSDAGEELTYNKRNKIKSGIKWIDIEGKNATLRVKEATKQNVYPRPNYEQLIVDGMQPTVAHIVKQVYDGLSVAPQSRNVSDDDIKLYITAVNRVMDGTLAWANDKENGAHAWIKSRVEQSARMIGTYRGALVDITSLGDNKVEKPLLDFIYPDGWHNSRSEVSIIGGNKALGMMQPGIDDLVKAMKDIEKGWPAKSESWAKRGYKVFKGDKLDARIFYYGEDNKGEIYGSVNIADGHHTVEQKKFDGAVQGDKAAEAYKDDRLSELSGKYLFTDKYSRLISAHDTEEEAINAAREKVKKVKKEDIVSDKGISVAAAKREGVAHRLEGENISSDQLKDAFAFNGVNFGNWMKSETPSKITERQLHLNHAYDSFMDLADILGIQPKAISLSGKLGLAIGAQGTGQYAAHFVPGVNEINLTRTSGAGSVAHEYGHALDHYFSVQAGLERVADPFITNNLFKAERNPGELRQEVLQAFKSIVEAMDKRTMTKEELAEINKSHIARLNKNIDSWLNGRMKNAAIALGKETEFNALAEKIRNNDLGDGLIAISPKTSLSPTVLKLRDLYKTKDNKKGYSLKDMEAVQLNLNSRNYQLSKKEEDSEHLPQTSSNYAAAARGLDAGKSKPYWSTPWEKFARAFDTFVSDTLEEKAVSNTYLSHAGREGDTVPSGEERKAINEAFKTLIGELKTKETDKGTVLYSKSSTKPIGSTVAQVKSWLPQRVKNMFRSGNLVIVQSASELPIPETGKVQGIYNPNVDAIYLVADNLSQEAIIPVLSHELMHRAETIDPKIQDALLRFGTGLKNSFENAAKGVGAPIELEAYRRVIAANTQKQDQSAEYRAYIVETYLKDSESFTGKLKQIFNDFIAAIRAVLIRNGLDFGFVKSLTPRDLVALSKYGAKANLSESQASSKEFASTTPERFYSALKRAFVSDKIPNGAMASPGALKQWLSNPNNLGKIGVKADEVYWSGITDWLDMQIGKVTRDDVLSYLNKNGVNVKDIVLGKDVESVRMMLFDYPSKEQLLTALSQAYKGSQSLFKEDGTLKDGFSILKNSDGWNAYNTEIIKPKHNISKLTLPGGSDYRELVITIPTTESFKKDDSTHFGDVGKGKQIAWIRYNERTDADGKKTLFLEEVQSQRGQEGRKKGFGELPIESKIKYLEESGWEISENEVINPNKPSDDVNNRGYLVHKNRQQFGKPALTKNEAWSNAYNTVKENGVPPAPFVTDSNNKATNAYITLLMKKAVSEAIDSGQTSVSWTTGDQQADRYDLSKTVDHIDYRKNSVGEFELGIVGVNGEGVETTKDAYTAEELEDVVGKDIADKIINGEGQLGGGRTTLRGVDLKIGGDWTQVMYGDENGLNAQGKPSMIMKVAMDIARKMGGDVGNVDLNSGKQPSLFITPEMKSRVLSEGMPLFSKSSAEPSNIKFSIASDINDAADKVKNSEPVRNIAQGVNGALDGLKMATMPQYRSDDAREVARLIIEGMGEKELQSIRFKTQLNKAIVEHDENLTLAQKARGLIEKGLTLAADKVFLKQSTEENHDFMQALDTEDKSYFDSHTDQKAIANIIDRMFADKAEQVRNLDTGALQEIRENYFPHIWNRQPDADVMQQIYSTLSKRPFEGKKGFTKQRVYDDVQAGLDAGLKLISNNPLDLVMLKMNEMDKYILAHTTLSAIESKSDAVKLIKAGDKLPFGYADINGRYGFIKRDGESLRYVGREDVAQVINNYLSPSLYHNKYVGNLFTGYMGAANILNQFQLGVFSAFHAGFTSFEAVISHASIGIKAATEGDFKGAAKYLKEAPLAWINNPKVGSQIVEELQFPGSNPEMAQIIQGLQMAGFKWHMDNRFRTDSTKKMLSAWEEGRKVTAGFHSINALAEQSARPILEWLVPRQKFGVFAEMYNKWIQDNLNATHDELRDSAQQIWNRVDSRLGQVVYDRLFTHNVAKNFAQMLLRAPGWTGGTILEVGGGIKDLAGYVKDLTAGRKPKGISDRGAYTLSMLLTTALVNALLTALFTGDAPDDWKDLVAFKTGNLDENGRPERFMLPTYMKDVYAYAQNGPITMLEHKSHPLLQLIGDITANRDYYGTEIRSEDENLLVQLTQSAGFVAKAFIPFWMQGVQKEKERGGNIGSMIAPLVGIMPSPSSLNKTAAEELMSQYGAERLPQGARTREETERSNLKRDMYVALRKGDRSQAGEIFKQGRADGVLTAKDFTSTLKKAKNNPLINSFKRLTYKQAVQVMYVANNNEKAQLNPLFRKKAIAYKKLYNSLD